MTLERESAFSSGDGLSDDAADDSPDSSFPGFTTPLSAWTSAQGSYLGR